MVLGHEILVYNAKCYSWNKYLYVSPLSAARNSLRRQAVPCIRMAQAGLPQVLTQSTEFFFSKQSWEIHPSL
jgi:hypothetical protein